MDTEKLLAELITAFAKEGIKEGVSFISTRFKRKDTKNIKTENSAVKNGLLGSLHWDKSATLFWIANDLMWIQDMMFRAALPPRILQGVAHVRQYLIQFGFTTDSYPIKQVDVCYSVLSSLVDVRGVSDDEVRILQQHYETINGMITNLKWFLSGLAEIREPGFEKHRAL